MDAIFFTSLLKPAAIKEIYNNGYNEDPKSKKQAKNVIEEKNENIEKTLNYTSKTSKLNIKFIRNDRIRASNATCAIVFT